MKFGLTKTENYYLDRPEQRITIWVNKNTYNCNSVWQGQRITILIDQNIESFSGEKRTYNCLNQDMQKRRLTFRHTIPYIIFVILSKIRVASVSLSRGDIFCFRDVSPSATHTF